jgi:3-oxoacid CoA-transferase A subunit
MINKIFASMEEAVSDIRDGDTVMVGGFGSSGIPFQLIEALRRHRATDLVVISNNAGVGDEGISALLRDRLVRKIICSYPRSTGSVWFERLYEENAIELELLPQGTFSERIRAGGAGIGGFFTRTGYGTRLAEGKETRIIDGKGYVFEKPLSADVALLKASRGDRWGNLVYNTAGRNFNPVMATAAKTTIAEVGEIVELGELEPECIVTPGIFVTRLVARKEQSA